jgi:hypothetical protein
MLTIGDPVTLFGVSSFILEQRGDLVVVTETDTGHAAGKGVTPEAAVAHAKAQIEYGARSRMCTPEVCVSRTIQETLVDIAKGRRKRYPLIQEEGPGK